MKLRTLLFAAIFFCTAVNAQTGEVKISGHLECAGSVQHIYLQNFDSIKISIPVDARNNFSFRGSLPGGFYELDSIGTVYLRPGYKLVIGEGRAQEGGYRFKGIGAFENNALRAAKSSPFISLGPDGDLLPAAYTLKPADFLRKLDSCENSGELLFRKSADSFFSKYAGLDLKFYGRNLCQLYYMHACGEAVGAPEGMPDSISFTKDVLKLAAKMKDLITRIYWAPWDRNDETLFRNSSSYRQVFEPWIDVRSGFQSSMDMMKNGVTKDKPGDFLLYKDRALVGTARKEISNPYIRSYFDYFYTRTLLNDSKDTAVLGKYYREYIARSSRADYQAAITEIYENALTYTDHCMAPPFSYRNTLGTPVSLKSLLGKYVYIDVWATWCGPCKAELPHLKEVETAYQDKNIEFVSISVDVQQNAEKWSAFVEQNGLKGIQLLTDSAFESAFVRKMGIHSIPRFILIDPSGRIIAADAQRPSDNGLRTTLDKLL